MSLLFKKNLKINFIFKLSLFIKCRVLEVIVPGLVDPVEASVDDEVGSVRRSGRKSFSNVSQRLLVDSGRIALKQDRIFYLQNKVIYLNNT